MRLIEKLPFVLALLFCLASVFAQAQPPIEPIIPIIDNGGKGGTKPPVTDPTGTPSGEKNGFDKGLDERTKEADAKKKELSEKKKTAQEELDQQNKEKDLLVIERKEKLPEAKIWGQQFFRDQSISLFTRSRDIKAYDSYLLDAGDELIIHVWGQAEYSCNAIVDTEGFIDVSGAGISMPRLYLRGMTFGNARKAVIERLANHMRIDKSQTAVTLNYSRDITVNITGEVFNPGSYTIPAINTAFNALVVSDGPSQIGSVRKIQIASMGKPLRTLDVYKFITNPTDVDDFFLRNNDYIYVPLAERVVEVRGSIRRPFFYELVGGEDLKKLLFYAGGLEADAYQKNIQIKRYVGDEERLVDVDLRALYTDSTADFNLFNGDIIIVSPIKQAYANYVKVTGAVKLPGEYELTKSTRVMEVLEKSGIIYSAVMDKIYIKRLREDLATDYIVVSFEQVQANPQDTSINVLLRPLDEIEVKYRSDFIDKYDIRVFGAVRKEGSYQYSPNLTLADVLYVSNGIRNEAAYSYVEISRLSRSGDSSYIVIDRLPIDGNAQVAGAREFRLEPYDQIFVRQAKAFELPMNVTLTGEVRYPGVYTISDRMETMEELLTRAGGTTELAFLEGATLQRPEEGFVLLDLRDIVAGKKSPYNYILRNGDQITIPKVRDLVSIAGRVRHPYIREKTEIAEINLELALKKSATVIQREEILAQDKIKRKESPFKVNVPFHPNKSARFYVMKYGAGIDRANDGRHRLVYVRYANGRVRKSRGFLFFRWYPKVERGAMVFVEPKPKKLRAFRERKGFDWNQSVQTTIAQLSAAATLALVLSTLLR